MTFSGECVSANTRSYPSDTFRFTDMRPTSEWVEMGELSFSLTKKGGRQQKLSGDEAEELGVAEFMAR